MSETPKTPASKSVQRIQAEWVLVHVNDIQSVLASCYPIQCCINAKANAM